MQSGNAALEHNATLALGCEIAYNPTNPKACGLKGRILSIDSELNSLVESVEGATGAIIVAVDGEAVQWGTSEQSERLRLRSAYVAVVMRAFRASSTRAGLGELEHLVVGYKGATLIAQRIDDDCSVMLELKSGASVSRAVYRVQTVVAKLRREIDA